MFGDAEVRKRVFFHWSFIGCERTNNEAEYGGALNLLQRVPVGACPWVQVFGDSDVVIQQVKRTWQVQSPNLAPLFHHQDLPAHYQDPEIIDQLERCFTHYSIPTCPTPLLPSWRPPGEGLRVHIPADSAEKSLDTEF